MAGTLDIANQINNSESIDQGTNRASQLAVQLATQKAQIDQQQQQAEMQKQQIDNAKFKGVMDTLGTYSKMSPGVQKASKNYLVSRLGAYGMTSGEALLNTLQSDETTNNAFKAIMGNPDFLKSLGIQGDQGMQQLNSMIDPMNAHESIMGLFDRMQKYNQLKSQETREDKRLEASDKRLAATLAARVSEGAANRASREKIQGDRLSTQQINSVKGLMNTTPIKNETTRLTAATNAQELINSIRNGELTDSKNISKQLTNLIARIEMGGPGAVDDRQSMGVDTLYTRAKALEGWISGHPTSVIPKAYLDQIAHEADALGNRALENYQNLTNAAAEGANLKTLKGAEDEGPIYRGVKSSAQTLVDKFNQAKNVTHGEKKSTSNAAPPKFDKAAFTAQMLKAGKTQAQIDAYLASKGIK